MLGKIKNKLAALLAKKYVKAILAALIVVGAAVTAFYYVTSPSRLIRPGHAVEGSEQSFDREIINIVLLGFDRDEARDRIYTIYRPDTIMIASLNLRETKVSVVNIPRDSYVPIHGRDFYDKINHSYAHGYNLRGVEDRHKSGLETTLRTIEDFLGGIPIHYYITIDMDGVVEVIDKVGGIEYDVDVTVRNESGRVLLNKGPQLLDGEKFLHYVRYRGVGGDTGRVSRQQKILIAAFSQLKEKGKLKDLPQIYKSLTENVETNLTLTQITALAVFGLKVDPEDINTYIFSGTNQFAPRGDQDISYLVIDERARVELIKEVFGITVEQRPQITLPGPRKREKTQEEGEQEIEEPAPVEQPSEEEPPGEGEEEPPGEEPPPGEEEQPGAEEPGPGGEDPGSQPGGGEDSGGGQGGEGEDPNPGPPGTGSPQEGGGFPKMPKIGDLGELFKGGRFQPKFGP
ncbi:MAG TPA: LCP family protein [Bacillota bacterium]|jgi:LCP family protein required for cell wall assembly|nr:LCP family protein [Bacillota bacterium]